MLSRELRPSAWHSPRSQHPKSRLSDSVALARAFFALGHTRTHDPRAIRLFTFTSAVAGRISMRIHLTSSPLYIRALIRGHTALSCDISLPRMSMCFCKLCTFPALALLRACLPAFLHFIHNPRNYYSVRRGEVCQARSLRWAIISRWNLGCGRMCQWTRGVV